METSEVTSVEPVPNEPAPGQLTLSAPFLEELATVGVFFGALFAVLLFSTHLKRGFAFAKAQRSEEDGNHG